MHNSIKIRLYSVTILLVENYMKKISLILSILCLSVIHTSAANLHTSAAKDTVDYTFPNAEITIGSKTFQLQTDGEADVYFFTSIYSNGRIAGTYTIDDVAPYGASIRIGENWADAIEYHLVITEQNYVYQAQAEMLGNNNILYRITATSHTLEPKSTADMHISNMTIDDITAMQGFFEINGSNAQYAVSVRVTADEITDGKYEENISATVTDAGGTSTSSQLVKLTLAHNTAYAEILGKNSVLYRVQMAGPATGTDHIQPAPTMSSKHLENGHLIITRDNQRFDFTGKYIR